MPTISQRGIDMPASPIRKLVPLANRAKAKGTVVYHLNIGQPDLATPEVALRAAHHLDREVLEYSPSEGILSFRKKLVEYYHKFNIDVCTDDIIITTGGSEAVFFSFMACLDPGDEIIVPEPAYANYMAFAISCVMILRKKLINLKKNEIPIKRKSMENDISRVRNLRSIFLFGR